MTTVLQYVIVAAVIGAVVFAIAVFVFGRGEQLAPLSPRTSPTELPDGSVTGSDVAALRFAMALRGYRMSDVDWALSRLGAEIDRLRDQVAELSGTEPTGSRPVAAVGAAGSSGSDTPEVTATRARSDGFGDPGTPS